MTLKHQVKYCLEKYPEISDSADSIYEKLLIEFYSGFLWGNTRTGSWNIKLENLWKLPKEKSFKNAFKSLN